MARISELASLLGGWERGSIFAMVLLSLPTALAAEREAGWINLPPFEVTALREDLPWEYGASAGVEVLTLCSRAYSREFAEAMIRGGRVLPREFQAEWTTPPVLDFDRPECGEIGGRARPPSKCVPGCKGWDTDGVALRGLSGVRIWMLWLSRRSCATSPT